MQHNHMQLYKSKNKIIIYRSNNLNQFVVISIENLNSTKLVGMLITDDLKWNNHIETICNKIIPYCFVLNKSNIILYMSALRSTSPTNFLTLNARQLAGAVGHMQKNYFKYKNGLLDQYQLSKNQLRVNQYLKN